MSMTLTRSVEVADAGVRPARVRPVHRAARAARRWLACHRRFEVAYRVLIGAVGGILILGGLILVPLPGPGWLVVFSGLAVLGTEFAWAHRVSAWLRHRLAQFWAAWRARRARRAARAARAAGAA